MQAQCVEGQTLHYYPTMATRAIAFQTKRMGRVRTLGTGYFALNTEWPHLEAWGKEDAWALHRIIDPWRNTEASAKGKVFFLGESEDEKFIAQFSCYQATSSGVACVYCGNSSAAAGAGISAYMGRNYGSVLNIHPIFDIPISFVASKAYNNTIDVQQEWYLPAISIDRVGTGEYKGNTYRSLNVFNDYFVFKDPIGFDINEFFHDHGRRRIDRKIVILGGNQMAPWARFYNINGLHGSAPQTGLLTLAILRTLDDWVATSLSGQVIETPGGAEQTPELTSAPDGRIKASMPEVSVLVNELSTRP